MPLGIVSDSEFESEVKMTGAKVPVNEINEKVIDIKRGRTPNKEEVPHSLRALVASEAISGASPKELEGLFNVSASSISAYKVGATSTSSYNNPDPILKRANDDVKSRIIGPAQSKLMAALNAITQEKLDECKVKDAAGVARDMSSIIKNMEGPDVVVNNNAIHVYRPRQREEEEYEVLALNE